MSEVYLTVKEMAELKGCTERSVQLSIERGKLAAQAIEIKGRGNAIKEYRIPLTALDAKLQVKYKRRQKAARTVTLDVEVNSSARTEESESFSHEQLSAAEREEIAFWQRLLREWGLFRSNSSLSKAESDEAFVEITKARLTATHPHISLSVRGLYRKQKAFQSQGEKGLLDGRGKHGNHNRKLTPEMFDIFEYYYLDNSKKTARLCRLLTGLELERLHGIMPELPSLGTFERAARVCGHTEGTQICEADFSQTLVCGLPADFE